MSTPSLLNIPYLYKAGTLYSQIPESGAGDFTVSRTTTVANRSTRINKDGFIETVLDNVPRLDYPVGGAVNGCPALLVEPAATNLVLQSQAFDVTWSPLIGGTGVNPAITTNAVISPDGTQNAERIVFNRGAGNTISDQSTLQQNVTIPTTGAYIFSVYAKASTAGDVGKQVFLRIGGAGALTAITLTANWVRYSRAESSVTSGSQAVQIGNRGTVTADNSVSVDLWGAQAEGGAIPTSYILTTTASVTRSADVIRKTNIPFLIGQSEGTVYFEVEVTDEARNKWFFTLDSASNSFIQAWIDPSRRVQIQIQNAAAIVMVALVSSTLSVGYHKVAFAYNTATNGCEMFIDGVQNPVASRTVTGAGLPAFNNFTFGSYLSTQSDTLKAHIRAGTLYPTRLPNTGPNSLTTLTT
jgi:hypothetical protein